MSWNSIRLCLAVLAVALCAAACGGTTKTSSGDKVGASVNTQAGPSPSPSTGSYSALIAQAGPICSQIANQRSVLTAAEEGAKSALQMVASVTRLAPPLATLEQRAAAHVRRLNMQGPTSASWTRLATDLQRLAKETRQLDIYAKQGNGVGLANVGNNSASIQAQLETLAPRLGVRSCSLAG